MDLSRLHITNTEDKTGLIDSTQKSKQEILINLWLEKNHSWLLSNIKTYKTNMFNLEK